MVDTMPATVLHSCFDVLFATKFALWLYLSKGHHCRGLAVHSDAVLLNTSHSDCSFREKRLKLLG